MNTSTATKTQYTPEDLLNLPDSKSYELVDGQLVERKMGIESSWVGGELLGLLREFCRANESDGPCRPTAVSNVSLTLPVWYENRMLRSSDTVASRAVCCPRVGPRSLPIWRSKSSRPMTPLTN